jgi:hypothetical protein
MNNQLFQLTHLGVAIARYFHPERVITSVTKHIALDRASI